MSAVAVVCRCSGPPVLKAAGHQASGRLRRRGYPRPEGARHRLRGHAWPGDRGRVRTGRYIDCMTGLGAFRLTQYARGGGCACKIPPGERRKP
jgi:hypothetical protein